MPTTLTPHPPGGAPDLGIVIMVEPGRYEWSGVLLVSSLLAFAYDDIAIHAYCRRGLIDQLHPHTLAFFERHGVALSPIDPGFAVPYPQGNKLYACAAPREAPLTLLLDTDMMMLRPARLVDAFRKGSVGGRFTSAWMWGKTVEDWRAAYASVGMEVPRHRMHRPNGSYVPPSIAAAFVIYEGAEFGGLWRDTALAIEERRLARGIYPTLDQISLPVATYRAGLRPNVLDAAWNKGGELTKAQGASVIVHHYQKAERLLASETRWIADAVLRDFARFDNVEALIAFYEAEGARPPEVDGNEGYRETVLARQREVDDKHRP
ncbi:hypothetical protein [Anianabacter salinae]|uniref:hypothetical protein n=1 Tax=Anianabacter salinae TaxID=2851023 RepID=UPI00225E18BF|nr:hypothetical protein [Anianabacter salinae]MBV0913169.1 hypothetical protein [Anianabacter salinae]